MVESFLEKPVKEEPVKEEQKHSTKKTEQDIKIFVDNQPQRKKSNVSYKFIEKENSNEKEKSNEIDININYQIKSEESSRKQSIISVVESSTPSNPEEIKIKPKLDFDQLLELELQKEGGNQNNVQDKGKPRKQFLKKGKMINQI